MTGLSAPPGLPPGQPAQPGEDLDEAVFRSVAEGLIVSGLAAEPLTVERAVAERLNVMIRELGEKPTGGEWDPKEDILRYTTGYLEDQQRKHCAEFAGELSAWADQLPADGQIRMLIHLWWECFGLWDRSLAYRTIEAVADAVADVVAGNAGQSARNGWQQDTWRAVGAALRVMYLDGLVFAQMNLSCADKVQRVTREAIPKLTRIRDDLGRAWRQLEDQPGSAWRQIRPCVSYMRGYADQTATYYGVMEKMAGALVEFEHWLASARRVAAPRPLGAGSPGLWPLSLDDAPRARVVESLEYLAQVKNQLSSHTLSEIEPWEQMLVGLLDLMTARPDRDVTPAVLIPRQVWVRYCFPFAVQNDDGKRASRLLRVPYEADPDDPRSAAPQHPLSLRLQEALDAVMGKHRMKIGEPVDLAQTEFFQDGEDGHFGGIRIQLPDLVFDPDFLDGVGPRPYRAWLDLNRMGNFCLCVEAARPLKEISPPRLYRALRAGTPFVFGEPVALAPQDAGEEVGGEAGQPLKWDNLYTFAWGMIKAATDAYCTALQQDLGAPPGPAHYVRGNLHEVVVVQTDGAIAVQSQEIARRLDSAVGGRILLRSVQRAAGTLEEWTRFPPLQHTQASGVVAVPEVGYAGDWFVHTGETTVFGIVAVPAWFRDVYPEAAQFASSWSPVLQLWNRRLQDALKVALRDLDSKHDIAAGNASNKLRDVEQQVRHHLAEINADDLCATLAYRRFLDSLLDAVGIGRLERELETQLQAAEQLTDYFYQQEEKRATGRRDILLFFIALLGVFSLADFLALLDTTNYHGQVGFIRLSPDGRWQDLLVLVLFIAALLGGIYVLFGINGPRSWLRRKRETWKRKRKRKRSAA
jgi:hypothetical protein